MARPIRWVLWALAAVFLIVSATLNLALFFARPHTSSERSEAVSPADASFVIGTGDEELAYLLVKLELRARNEMATHFTRKQSAIPGVTKLYQRLLVRNRMLPAAVADRIFGETVPDATAGRAWVKMVVDQPRNPNNRGDSVALELLGELRGGASTAQREAGGAYYYAEPIRAKAWCLYCHGNPKGAPDPYFPQFTKDGWREDQIIGAVVAQVAPATLEAAEPPGPALRTGR